MLLNKESEEKNPVQTGDADGAPVEKQENLSSTDAAEGVAPSSTSAAEVGENQAVVAADPPPTSNEEEQAKVAPKKDWREKRLEQEYARRKQLEDRLRAYEEGTTQATSSVVEGQNLSEAEINAKIEALAEQKARRAAFDADCNAVASTGKEKFGDEFTARVKNIQAVIPPYDQKAVSSYNQLLEMAIETGVGERVLFELGSDPNLAEEVLSLSPAKMALKVAKLAEKKADPEPSSAPKPITPVGQKGAAHTDIDPSDPSRADKLDEDDWFRRREEQVAKNPTNRRYR